MPMELYSSEALIRDLVNAISSSEGKPLNLGGHDHRGIDRTYAYQLIVEAKRAYEGQVGTAAPSAAGQQAASRTAKIKKFMADLERQEAAAKQPRARAATKTAATKAAAPRGRAATKTVAPRSRAAAKTAAPGSRTAAKTASPRKRAATKPPASGSRTGAKTAVARMRAATKIVAARTAKPAK